MLTKPGVLLRLEGAIALALSMILYRHAGGGWARFAGLFLVPDISLAGYALSARAGARVYNAVHTFAGPLALAALAILSRRPEFLPYALIWTAHLGMDRALGFGLKYATGFADTHLRRAGRAASA